MKIEKNSFGHKQGGLLSLFKNVLVCFCFFYLLFFISNSLIKYLLNFFLEGFFLDFENLLAVSVLWGSFFGLIICSYDIKKSFRFKDFKNGSYIRIIRLPRTLEANDFRSDFESCDFIFSGQKFLPPGEDAFWGVASRRVFDHLRLNGFQEGGLVKFVKKQKPLSDEEKELGVVQIPLSLDYI